MRGSSTSSKVNVRWTKSTFSGPSGQGACVEVATMEGSVLVRDSKDPSGRALRFTRAEWIAFLLGIRAGEFDLC